MSLSVLMLLVFFGIQFFDVPIFVAIGVSIMAVIATGTIFPLSTLVSGLFASVDSFPLVAVPFFILAGEVMVQGGIANRLINFAQAIVGGLKGSLAIVTVVACMFFAAISGSGVATAAAIGGVMIPAMRQENYSAGFAAGLTASASAVGPIIPPSISFIIYGVMCQVSITKLFIGGIVPGVLIGVFLMIVSYIAAKKYGYGKHTNVRKVSFVGKLKALWDAKWSLLVPVAILCGIYGGVFSPTEAAIVATDLGLIIGFFIYREIKLSDLGGILIRTAKTTGLCLCLIGFALVFGRVLVMDGVPQSIATAIKSFTNSQAVVLLLLNLVLLVAGMLLETSSAVTICSPILLAIAKVYGVDPVHFGIILVTNLCIGLATPPVGQSLFVATGIAKIPIAQTFKPLYACIGASVLALLIITYCEPLTMFLPRMM
jgi:C4-dicarboxylate transporter DctM subunit